MKEDYKSLFYQIHAPEELNQRVLSKAALPQEKKAPRRSGWFRPVICMAGMLILLMGGILCGLPKDLSSVPFGGLVLTASAADMPPANKNGGLGIVWDNIEKRSGQFQIQGTGIQRVTLQIDNGVLYREGSTEAQTFIEDTYTDHLNYGIQLTGQSGILTVTANDKETFSYTLTMEELRLSQSADGQAVLVPLLSGDTAQKIKGIYAVDESKCRWLLWPVERSTVIDLSRPYGDCPNGKFHTGIDIPAEQGTNIFAADDGTIIESGFSQQDGNYIILNHGNGLVTKYSHCRDIYVHDGDTIKKGDVIASVGKTGMAVGAFLHFEVQQDGVSQDPTAYFEADVREQLSMK